MAEFVTIERYLLRRRFCVLTYPIQPILFALTIYHSIWFCETIHVLLELRYRRLSLLPPSTLIIHKNCTCPPHKIEVCVKFTTIVRCPKKAMLIPLQLQNFLIFPPSATTLRNLWNQQIIYFFSKTIAYYRVVSIMMIILFIEELYFQDRLLIKLQFIIRFLKLYNP